MDIASEAQWLIDNPHFRERPMTLEEFLGPRGLNIMQGRAKIWDRNVEVLRDMMGNEVNPLRPTSYELALYTGAIGVGKGLRATDTVPTPIGWRAIRDLQVGDYVFGSEGKPTMIEGLFNRGTLPVFRVAFSDGTFLDVDSDHLWEVSWKSTGGKFKSGVLDTQTLMNKKLKQGDSYRYRIPQAKPVQYAEADLPVDPYLMGLLLGDGCLTKGTIELSGDDLEVVDYFKVPAGVHVVRHEKIRRWTFATYPTNSPNPLLNTIRELGLHGKGHLEKTIPEVYMTASADQRLAVIQGLMDSDGSQFGRNCQVFSSNNVILCQQIKELAESLGGVARITQFERRETVEYQVKLNLGDICPFRLERKKAKWKPRTNQKPIRSIVSITPVGQDEVICLKVAAEDELFLARNYIVTHNTTIASVVLTYLVHWVLCLEDPQSFYNLLPGSRIAFMMMSTTEKQARQVLFDDTKGRIKESPWFKDHPFDPAFKNQIRFENNIWILPGDSQETTFEGYNILGGVLDEADCVDGDTTILTSSGWKSYEELEVGDQILTLNHESGESEWQPCLEVKVFPAESRRVVSMEGKEFSSLTTLNHRWPVLRPRVRKSVKHLDRVWTTSAELGFRDRILRCAPPGDLPTVATHSDALVEAVAWFYTEGHDRQGAGKTAWIHQSPKNAENCERIRSCLAELFGSSVEAFPRQGRNHDGIPRWREELLVRDDAYWGSQHRFVLSVAAGEQVQRYAPNRVPTFEFLRSLTKSQLELFIEVSLLADNNGERRFAQKDLKSAEAYAFACVLSGRPVSIRPHQPTSSCPSIMHNVYSSRKDHHAPRAAANMGKEMRIEWKRHAGVVWCPRVKNSSWLARRNGSVYFTGNSHKTTDLKDYADVGFETITNRMTSRFDNRGFLLIIGQMKKSSGFAKRKYEEYRDDPNKYAVRLTQWEAKGEQYYRDRDPDGEYRTFFYDPLRKSIVSDEVAQHMATTEHLMRIPVVMEDRFRNEPEKALRDLAGIPPAVEDPFISLVDRIHECRTRWEEEHGPGGPILGLDGNKVQPGFRAPNTLPRVAHIDVAYASMGDALGFAMGHIPRMVEIDGELKPQIEIDVLYRLRAAPGQEIHLADVRQFVYYLRDTLGFNLEDVTLDGHQCFTGDTRIPLLDGRTLTMAELASQHPDGDVYVYSCSNNRIKPGYVSRAWKSGTKKVVRVLLDNGEVVRCTEDHRWMLRDGTFREARDLRHGDALMPLERRITPPDWRGMRGYEQVKQPGSRKTGRRRTSNWKRGRWQFTHRMAAGPKMDGLHVHHINFDKLNNDPRNLQILDSDDHQEIHHEQGDNDFGCLWRDPEFRTKTIASVTAANRRASGENGRRYRHEITIESLKPYAHLARREVTELTGWSQDMIYDRVRKAGYEGWKDFRESVGTNHRVVAVEDHGEVEDVYDLQVDQYHNFALEAGVFVHNSRDMQQQFKRKRFRSWQLSVDKEKLPYHDLREAIYQGRLTFPPYVVNYSPVKRDAVDILTKELEELMDTPKKVDHPVGGSKDVADAVAAVVTNLMGNTRYHRSRGDGQHMLNAAIPVDSILEAHELHRPNLTHHAMIPAHLLSPIAPPAPRSS